MDETLRQQLLAKTKEALDADDWRSVVRLWQPWVDQGDAEAAYQLAYHYLWCTPCDDDAECERMKDLVKRAAAMNHADAIWFLATRETHSGNREYDQEILRAGLLGSLNAQRELGVMYATGDWSGPKDLAEATRWYRLAAEEGHALSQYDLGFMLLLGEGGPVNIEEGLMWLERAGEQGEQAALRLLADCYENGFYGVAVDARKALLWRDRLAEYERLHPPKPSRRYSISGTLDHSTLDCLWDIEGVIGFGFAGDDNRFSVSYEPTLITPAQLDDKIQATLAAVPTD